MAQSSNFVHNIFHIGITPIDVETIPNSDIIQDMALSPSFAYKYKDLAEVDIGAGYSVKLTRDLKMLYKDGIKCNAAISPSCVVVDINLSRGRDTSRIGTNISNNYGLHMSPDKAFQLYKREVLL